MIDYGRIQRSIDFYRVHEFQRIESPWTVTKAVSSITKPSEKEDWYIENKNKVLVASGEQSFLYLYLKGFLPKGKFQTVTPCFREDVFDETHTKYFIKNELIITDEVNESSLKWVVAQCKKFFELELDHEVKIIELENSIDLEVDGIRKCDYLEWIYATGCAEPRMSHIKRRIQNGLSRKSNSYD